MASQPSPALLEEPSQQMAQLSMVTELLQTRTLAVEKLNQQAANVQAQIASAKRQWKDQQDAETVDIRRMRVRQNEEHTKQMNAVHEMVRTQQDRLEEIRAQQTELRQRIISVHQKEEAVSKLNEERFEIGKLRLEAKQKILQAQQEYGRARAMQDNADQRQELAKKTLAECEARNKESVERLDQAERWQKDLSMKAKDLEIVEREVDEKLKALVAKEASHVQAG